MSIIVSARVFAFCEVKLQKTARPSFIFESLNKFYFLYFWAIIYTTLFSNITTKMEYENCASEQTLFGLSKTTVGLIVVIITLLIIYYFTMRRREKFTDRSDEILAAVGNTMKEQGSIVDFKRSIQDPKFSATKYIYLVDLYRRGKLDKDAVTKVLDDANI